MSIFTGRVTDAKVGAYSEVADSQLDELEAGTDMALTQIDICRAQERTFFARRPVLCKRLPLAAIWKHR